jgi:inosine-uridine nucleoside N-ribohydrolase
MSSGRRKIILDCDPGTDDALAVLLALASPELEVRAITVAGGNATLTRTLANALGLVALAGAASPVYAGAGRALLGPFPPGWPGHGEDGMAGVALPVGAEAAEGVAADAIRAALRAAAAPITLVGIAPATNLALALATEPALAGAVAEIVLMSGAVGPGNATPAAEFNAHADPEALAILAAAGPLLTLVPLEAGRAVRATEARAAALAEAGSGRALGAAAAILAAYAERAGEAGGPLYDPLAIAWLVRPALFRARAVSLAVDLGPGRGRGRTQIAPAAEGAQAPGASANARLLEPIDPDGVFALLAERLTRLP